MWTVLLAGAAYVLVGTATAMLAGRASSPVAVKGWRTVAWLLSLAVFGIHVAYVRGRGDRRLSVALQVALGVAVGALGLAVLGPVRTHWADASRLKLVALSLLLWPLLTGIPALVATLLAGFILDRVARRR